MDVLPAGQGQVKLIGQILYLLWYITLAGFKCSQLLIAHTHTTHNTHTLNLKHVSSAVLWSNDEVDISLVTQKWWVGSPASTRWNLSLERRQGGTEKSDNINSSVLLVTFNSSCFLLCITTHLAETE